MQSGTWNIDFACICGGLVLVPCSETMSVSNYGNEMHAHHLEIIWCVSDEEFSAQLLWQGISAMHKLHGSQHLIGCAIRLGIRVTCACQISLAQFDSL